MNFKQIKRYFKQNGVFFIEGASRSETGHLKKTLHILAGPKVIEEIRFATNGQAEPLVAVLNLDSLNAAGALWAIPLYDVLQEGQAQTDMDRYAYVMSGEYLSEVPPVTSH